MCLTEPQAGSDLGLIRTQAIARDDGRWSVTGTKIFISNGDHDLTTNIIHLVLARTPDAPPGTAGISMFAVPKYNIGEHRVAQERNGVAVLGVEHKHGIRGNATCTLAFEQASGWLVGDLHRGLNCMFRLMNSARLAVGVQSVGLAEVAYQNALAHARARLQGRAISGPQRPDLPADPLVAHPGVRARLIEMRLFIEAARLLTTWVATLLDQARGAEDEDLRRRCGMLAELLTPMVKGYLSEHAIRNIESAMRLYGGAGYIIETGIEQVLRDATICPIYEGTNDIQALDLLGRKVVADQGIRLGLLLEEIQTLAARLQDSELEDLSPLLADHASSLGATAQSIVVESVFDREIVALAAPDFLELAGGVVFAYLWARMAEAAMLSGDARLRDDKCALARYYMHRSRDRTTAIAKKIAKARHDLERLGSASPANMALAG